MSSESGQAPKFDVPLEPVMVSEGEKLTLKCHVNGQCSKFPHDATCLLICFAEGTATFIAKIGGDPIPSVKWMKGKWRQITPGGRIAIEHKGQDAKMEIREVTKSDAGLYRCVATNKHGEIECGAEIEKVPGSRPGFPGIFLHGNGVLIKAGESLRLPAVVTGRPQPEVKWAKDEADIDKERMIVETEGKNSTLFIKKAVRADHGKYQITGTNSSGTKTAETRVDVMGQCPWTGC
uniref:Ig-like domain-containing protein n=1 Tax=Amphiprion percula TaxID=161767 RepID=A0A3P8SVN7_AMPPE